MNSVVENRKQKKKRGWFVNLFLKCVAASKPVDIEDEVTLVLDDLLVQVEDEHLMMQLAYLDSGQDVKRDENIDSNEGNNNNNLPTGHGQGWKNLLRPPLTSTRILDDPRWPAHVPRRTRIEWLTSDTDEDEADEEDEEEQETSVDIE